MIILNSLIALGLLTVLIILGFGVYSMARGGEFNAKWGNRLMRYRVAAGAVTVLLLLLGFVANGQR